MLHKAIDIAVRAHAGQFRKYTGLPYIVHPMEVMSTLLQAGVEDQYVLSAAALHDVVEDCDKHFHKEIAELDQHLYYMVKCLSKGTEDFRHYEIQLVKTADIGSNTRDSSNRSYLKKKLAQLDTFDLVNKQFFYKKIRGNIQIALGEAM